MQGNSEQFLRNLKQTLDKDLSELRQKEAEYEKLGASNTAMENEFRTNEALIRQKELEIQHMRLDMTNKKRIITENIHKRERLKQEITGLKRKQEMSQMEVNRTERLLHEQIKESERKNQRRL